MYNRDKPTPSELTRQRSEHAKTLARTGELPHRISLTLSEALVLGLLRQNVKIFLTVFGHGSTEVGEVLRIYQQEGLVRVYGVRSEIEASHAAAALRWVTGEKAAVVTSIGPGALQALAASLVPASDGIGVWYLFGDETSEDEGFNMQQIPRHEQGLFLQLAAGMGRAYSLHTPLALPTALQRGAATVDHPYRPGPFYLLLPMNTQSAWLPDFNLKNFRKPYTPPWARQKVITIQQWNGSRKRSGSSSRLVVVEGQPVYLWLILSNTQVVSWFIHPSRPDAFPTPIHRTWVLVVPKARLPGNYAMENADLLIAVGTRAVCQSDCSRTGYPNVKRVININADLDDATHYHHTLALLGDVNRTLVSLDQVLSKSDHNKNEWLADCAGKKNTWQAFKSERINSPVLEDDYWGGPVLTQPAAIKIATDWAKKQGAVSFFDAGDVQANGFQIVEDEHPWQTFTEAGASYMGFAVSALLVTGVASKPFYGLALTGDGSFTMNPQILIDGVEHGARGCILLLDNGRMGAITGLQQAPVWRRICHLELDKSRLPRLGSFDPRLAGAGRRTLT